MGQQRIVETLTLSLFSLIFCLSLFWILYLMMLYTLSNSLCWNFSEAWVDIRFMCNVVVSVCGSRKSCQVLYGGEDFYRSHGIYLHFLVLLILGVLLLWQIFYQLRAILMNCFACIYSFVM